MTDLTPEPPPVAREYAPIHPQGSLRPLVKRLASAGAVLLGLALKFKAAALVVLKLKVFATAGTMLVSIAAYAYLWSWKFAIGFVLLILVHELGHVIELRRQGVPASAPLFIPFLGAVVGMKELPKDAWREARVALAGPLLGSLGAAGVWVAGSALDSDFLRALAFTGFFLNLFNLLPVVPLDGGRAVAALHPALWAVGLAGLVGLTVWHPNPILLIVLLFGALELWRRWRTRGTPESHAYYQVTKGQRATVAVTYLGLAALLAVAMTATHVERTF